jgi:hypothetical protein
VTASGDRFRWLSAAIAATMYLIGRICGHSLAIFADCMECAVAQHAMTPLDRTSANTFLCSVALGEREFTMRACTLLI